MKPLLEFLRRKAPRAGKEASPYFSMALSANEIVLAAYFLLTFALLTWAGRRPVWAPALLFAATLGCRYSIGRVNSRASLYAIEIVVLLGCAWHTCALGWSFGAIHLLIPMLLLCFFDVCEPPQLKLGALLFAFAFSTILFAYSLEHPAQLALGHPAAVAVQVLGLLALFSMLGISLIMFSSSVQESERQLLINNRELQQEAGTDPLTGLPNRRALLDYIERYRRANPESQFCIAIADIDFFKKINDTYGHNCGDYTLQRLAALFLSTAQGRYRVCRWGGEEFCFFMPDMNLDEAGAAMRDLCFAVKMMQLEFEDVKFSVTITIGVEEFDFQSSTDALLDRADRKLYMGKVHGRDQVVV